MTARREVLFLAHRIPYPPDKGDKIRSWRILEALTQRFETHLAAFVDDPVDLQHTAFLRTVCASVFLKTLSPRSARARSALGLISGEPLSFAYYRDSAMAAAVRRLRQRPLAAEIVFSSAMAPYVAAPAGRPRVIDLCDADSEKWRQYAVETTGPMRFIYAREGRKLAAEETRMIDWADAAFAISPEEARVLNARGGAKQALWFSNGVDADYFHPDPTVARPRDVGDVAFVGAMDYRANVDAVMWFAREVWPLIRAGAPQATFAVVGSRPTRQAQALSGADGVFVTGRVPDVRPYLQHARAVVAPLRVARGVQNKVLEAMAAARPVVATSDAAEGIDAARDAHFLCADDPRTFAEAVLRLLADPAFGDSLGAAARAQMISRCSWPAQMARFRQSLDALGL